MAFYVVNGLTQTAQFAVHTGAEQQVFRKLDFTDIAQAVADIHDLIQRSLTFDRIAIAIIKKIRFRAFYNYGTSWLSYHPAKPSAYSNLRRRA